VALEAARLSEQSLSFRQTALGRLGVRALDILPNPCNIRGAQRQLGRPSRRNASPKAITSA
jgi:hypothetical protein